MSELSTI